jgi:hypothetical protein
VSSCIDPFDFKTEDEPEKDRPASAAAKDKAEKADAKKLVKQKSLGRTLSTSVLRIKKKRSFWSSEKVGQ